jgi:hypothetical protein
LGSYCIYEYHMVCWFLMIMNYPSKLFIIEQDLAVMQNANLHYVVDDRFGF